jgi:hypothetical protein
MKHFLGIGWGLLASVSIVGAPVRVDHPKRARAGNRMPEQEVVEKSRDMCGVHMSDGDRYAE